MAAAESQDADRDDTNRRGFDRLRDRLSREEVQALRLYFYPQLSLFISQAERVPGESSEDRIYRLEEEWMDAQGPQSEFCTSVQLDEFYRSSSFTTLCSLLLSLSLCLVCIYEQR